MLRRLRFAVVLVAMIGLLAACADSDSGSTSLIDAVSAETYPRVVALVRSGADVNETDSEGYSPLMAASNIGDLRTATFLIARGARVNARTDVGWTALMSAASSSRSPALVSFLLAQGANPCLRAVEDIDDDDEVERVNAVQIAVGRGEREIAAILRRATHRLCS
jgi:ankyrin repeat protein